MTLTAEQVRAMKSGTPLRFKLAEDGTEFVVVRADVFDSRGDIADDEFHPTETYAAFWNVAGPAGWDDPEMNEFDEAETTS